VKKIANKARKVRSYMKKETHRVVKGAGGLRTLRDAMAL